MEKTIKPKVKRILSGFEIDNGSSVYRLMEKMTSSMNQDKLAEYYNIEKSKGNPVPMNSIQHLELFNDAVKSGNKELINFLQEGLRRGLNTLTRVGYNPAGKEDEVTHTYGTFDAYSVFGDIVGKDGWIKDVDNPNALELLLKTKDIKLLNEISNKINSTPMSFWRIDSKPSEKIERVVRFYADDNKLDLDADRYLRNEGPAFLVEKIK